MLEDYLKQNGSDKNIPLLLSSQDDACGQPRTIKHPSSSGMGTRCWRRNFMTPQPQISSDH